MKVTDIYLRLSYEDYKKMEEQLRDYSKLETTHESVDGYYHKSFRIKLGDLTLEIHGPIVKV